MLSGEVRPRVLPRDVRAGDGIVPRGGDLQQHRGDDQQGRRRGRALPVPARQGARVWRSLQAAGQHARQAAELQRAALHCQPRFRPAEHRGDVPHLGAGGHLLRSPFRARPPGAAAPPLLHHSTRAVASAVEFETVDSETVESETVDSETVEFETVESSPAHARPLYHHHVHSFALGLAATCRSVVRRRSRRGTRERADAPIRSPHRCRCSASATRACCGRSFDC